MGILAVLTEAAVVLALLLSVGLSVVVGPRRVRHGIRNIRARARTATLPIAGLASVLVLNGVVRDYGVSISWLIGLNLTDEIYAVEGAVVAVLQSAAPLWFVYYLGYVYVYGYVFLLVFPLLAAIVTDERGLLRRTALAYTVNYAVGMTCYLLFVSYGPRNAVPAVEPLLFDLLPRFQLLTSQVNANTNVFPSLHTSLSVTAALLAVDDHGTFPKWTPVAVVLATSIVLSTMVLGIHWATDVVAGALLAVFSVRVATSDRVTAVLSS